jgi:hypothetical protein
VCGRYLSKLDTLLIYLLEVWAAIAYMNITWYVGFSLKLNILRSYSIRTLR